MGLFKNNGLQCTRCGSPQGATRGWLINGLCPTCSPPLRDEAHAFEAHPEGWCLRCGYEKKAYRHSVPAVPPPPPCAAPFPEKTYDSPPCAAPFPEKTYDSFLYVESVERQVYRVSCTCGVHCNYDGPNARTDALNFRDAHRKRHEAGMGAPLTPAPAAPTELRPPSFRRRSLLHRLWTKAVGTPGYAKEEWKEFERQLMVRPRDRVEAPTPPPAALQPSLAEQLEVAKTYLRPQQERLGGKFPDCERELGLAGVTTRAKASEPPYPDATDLLCEDEEP